MSAFAMLQGMLSACVASRNETRVREEILRQPNVAYTELVSIDSLSSYIDEGNTFIAKIQKKSGAQDLQLYVDWNSNRAKPFLVGPLRKMFTESPFALAFFEFRNTRFITGLIDSGFPETLDYISFHHATINRKFSLNDTKNGRIHRARDFLIPIFANEFTTWQSIQEISIVTKEHLERVKRQNEYPPRPFEVQYDPALNIDQLFVPVRQVG